MPSRSKIRQIRRPCFNIDGGATLWTVALKRPIFKRKKGFANISLGLNYCYMGSSWPRSRDTVPLNTFSDCPLQSSDGSTFRAELLLVCGLPGEKINTTTIRFALVSRRQATRVLHLFVHQKLAHHAFKKTSNSELCNTLP
jgi:hypothetical protein